MEQDKDVHLHYSIQHHTGRSSQCNKTIKRNLKIVNTDRKGKQKTGCIHRKHDCQCRESKRAYQETF